MAELVDLLTGIRSKIKRAKKHVSDLDVAIRAFLDSGPYKVGTERNPDTRELIYHVIRVRDVPQDRVYFPITRNATNAAEYVAARERKVEGIEPTIVITALDALEPYEGGKRHQFWVLNELNNLLEYRDLIAVGSTADPLCPLQVGDELSIDALDAEPDPEMEFTFDVTLDEPQIIQAEPLIEPVHQLASLVDSIVGLFARYL